MRIRIKTLDRYFHMFFFIPPHKLQLPSIISLFTRLFKARTNFNNFKTFVFYFKNLFSTPFTLSFCIKFCMNFKVHFKKFSCPKFTKACCNHNLWCRRARERKVQSKLFLHVSWKKWHKVHVVVRDVWCQKTLSINF